MTNRSFLYTTNQRLRFPRITRRSQHSLHPGAVVALLEDHWTRRCGLITGQESLLPCSAPTSFLPGPQFLPGSMPAYFVPLGNGGMHWRPALPFPVSSFGHILFAVLVRPNPAACHPSAEKEGMTPVQATADLTTARITTLSTRDRQQRAY